VDSKLDLGPAYEHLELQQRSSALLTSGVFNHNGELCKYVDIAGKSLYVSLMTEKRMSFLATSNNWTTVPDNYHEIQQNNTDPTSASQNSSETLEGSDEANAKQDELKRHLRLLTNKNQQLEAECAQLKRLLKDYETGLESATSSMRLQVVSTNYNIN
jgi:hypothetical protein